MDNKVKYFSHDTQARNDAKIENLRMKHGLTGLGAYWCIVEMLYENNGYIKIQECERIAFALRTECELIKSIIFDFNLFTTDDEKFWSESALRRLGMIEDKSIKARESAKKRWNQSFSGNNANAMQSHNEGNANKINETKTNTYISAKVSDKKITKREAEPHPLNEFIKKTYPDTISKLGVQMTAQQCDELVRTHDKKFIQDVLERMDNWEPLVKKRKDVFRTFRTFAKNDFGRKK